MAAAALTLTLATTPATGTGERVTVTTPTWVPPLIRRLAVCESRGVIPFQAGSYEGIVAWHHDTWLLDRYLGMPAHAYQASLQQQVRVAVRSVARGRTFGCLNHAWVRYG